MAGAHVGARGGWRIAIEDAWNFDVTGAVVKRGLLDAEGVRSCDRELINLAASEATQQDLIQTKLPAVHELVMRLCGDPVPLYGHIESAEVVQYRLDRLPQLLPRADVSRARPEDRHRLQYDRNARPDRVSVRGVRLLLVLDDGVGDEVALVPGTHKGELPPPTSLRRMDELDATLRPTLHKGDVLLLAATTIVGRLPLAAPGGAQAGGVPPRVLELVLSDARLAAPALGYLPPAEPTAPAWYAELKPEQLAVLGPRHGLPRADLATDGYTEAWVAAETVDKRPQDGSDGWEIQAATEAERLVAEEQWQWNTQGFLVVRDVMDPAWLTAANTALDYHREDTEVVGTVGASELWGWSDCSPTLAPLPEEQRPHGMLEETMDMMDAPPPHCDPFRKMVAHPAVVQRLNWMLGPGWSQSAGSAKVSRSGSGGQQMHGGPFYGRIHGAVPFSGGRGFSSQVNFHWTLTDVQPGDGGFCVIPASPKMKAPIPRPPTTSIDLPAVRHLASPAGSIVFYEGGAATHGVMGWRGARERRQVLQSAGPRTYSSGGLTPKM
jgi:hypothetical protein